MIMYDMSFCIPTYNGQDVLGETLDSIVKEVADYSIEIVINDDKSIDNTLKIANEYANKYSFISVYQNEKNLRMDRNFTATAIKASGKYVWFCGQDDILQNGAVEKAIKIIEQYKDISFIYFNYKFVDDNLIKEVMPPKLSISEDKYFKNEIEYFETIKYAPTFLPANIMKREFWLDNVQENYFDTYYVQVGVWLDYCQNRDVYVVSDPEYVLCRVPVESWKYNDGKMLYETEIGKLRVYKTALNRKKIDEYVFNNMKELYINSALLNIIASKAKGLVISRKNIDDLEFIFGKSLRYYLHVRLITFIPIFVAKIAYVIGKKLRKLIKGR